MADLLIITPSGSLTGDKTFAGAKATFFLAGTTTPATVYSDGDLTIPHASPLVAGADGLWPEIFIGGDSFKAVVVYSDNTTCYTLDPCPKSSAFGSAASSISFSPTPELPYNNVQRAIEGVLQSFGADINLIINGRGRINQRAYVSGTATSSAGQYTLDRWKVVTSGQNLTFTGDESRRTMTAPAGGVEQVIEAANVIGGTYAINWTGSATATINGTGIAKGQTFVLSANTNATVRFTGGTFTDVQVALGSVGEYNSIDIGEELRLCQRYYQISGTDNLITFSGNVTSGSAYFASTRFPVQMRAVPSVTATNQDASASFTGVASSLIFSKEGIRFARTAISSGSGQYFNDSWNADAEI